MVKILATNWEIICFPRQGWGWKALDDQCCDMASRKSSKGCTVSGRLLVAASLPVLGKKSELRNWMLEEVVKTKGCSSIQFLQKRVLLIARIIGYKKA